MSTSEDKLKGQWIIECDEDEDAGGGVAVKGGLCVSANGIILTSSLNICNNGLRGRIYKGDWIDLVIMLEKPNFNLALVRVKVEDEDEDEDDVIFSCFDFGLDVNVSKGDLLESVIHRWNRPFCSVFGRSCRPFASDQVNFPCMDSTTVSTFSNTCHARREVIASYVPYLQVAHVIDVAEEEGEDGDDMNGRRKSEGGDDTMDDVTDSDSEEANVDGDDMTGKSKSGEVGDDTDMDDVSNSEDSDCDANANVDTDEDDGKPKPPSFLHPNIPVIQSRGIGSVLEASSCPVFNESEIMIGILCFEWDGFEYIIPKSFLKVFIDHFLPPLEESVNKLMEGKSKKRMGEDDDVGREATKNWKESVPNRQTPSQAT